MLPFLFERVYVIDFEFYSEPGELPKPVCVVSKELVSGEIQVVWLEGEDSGTLVPPYSINENDLFVAFYSSAEWNCHLVLDWPLPGNVIDLFAEFRRVTNGVPDISNSLLGACKKFGILTIDEAEKEEARRRILQGPPFSEAEKAYILKYCASDVEETTELFKVLVNLPGFDLQTALFHGEYMKAIAKMEHRGIPVDTGTLTLLKENWNQIQERLIQEIDRDYGVYDGRAFKVKKFEKYLADNGIPWKRTEEGNLSLDYETFKTMAQVYPQLEALKVLRHILGQLRLSEIPVGSDGRNRCLLSPFSSLTGRNYPSTKRFLFANAKWLRSLMKPEKGKVVAYIDFEQQEFGIVAYLSNDSQMIGAYESGDPYLSFAKLAGVVPETATKATHPAERKLFKECLLGVQYGMGKEGLAVRIKKSPDYAQELLNYHRRAFKRFWEWQDLVVNSALLFRRIDTGFGWQFFLNGRETKPKTLQNFPAQAIGAEILRVACVLLEENGIQVIGPVHDALLVEYDEEEADERIMLTVKLMEQASELVLGIGNKIRASPEAVIRYPDRYQDDGEGVQEMWNRILAIAKEIQDIRQEPPQVSGEVLRAGRKVKKWATV